MGSMGPELAGLERVKADGTAGDARAARRLAWGRAAQVRGTGEDQVGTGGTNDQLRVVRLSWGPRGTSQRLGR